MRCSVVQGVSSSAHARAPSTSGAASSFLLELAVAAALACRNQSMHSHSACKLQASNTDAQKGKVMEFLQLANMYLGHSVCSSAASRGLC